MLIARARSRRRFISGLTAYKETVAGGSGWHAVHMYHGIQRGVPSAYRHLNVRILTPPARVRLSHRTGAKGHRRHERMLVTIYRVRIRPAAAEGMPLPHAHRSFAPCFQPPVGRPPSAAWRQVAICSL